MHPVKTYIIQYLLCPFLHWLHLTAGATPICHFLRVNRSDLTCMGELFGNAERDISSIHGSLWSNTTRVTVSFLININRDFSRKISFNRFLINLQIFPSFVPDFSLVAIDSQECIQDIEKLLKNTKILKNVLFNWLFKWWFTVWIQERHFEML